MDNKIASRDDSIPFVLATPIGGARSLHSMSFVYQYQYVTRKFSFHLGKQHADSHASASTKIGFPHFQRIICLRRELVEYLDTKIIFSTKFFSNNADRVRAAP